MESIVEELKEELKSSYIVEQTKENVVKVIDKRTGDLIITMAKGFTVFLKPICLGRDALNIIHEISYMTTPYSMTKKQKEIEEESIQEMRDEIGKELWIGMEGDRD